MWDGGRTKLKLYWCQHYPLRTFLLSIFWLAPKWRLGISDYDKWCCRAWSDNLQCPVQSCPVPALLSVPSRQGKNAERGDGESGVNVLSVYQDNHHCFLFASLSIKFLIEGEQTEQLRLPGLQSQSDCPGENVVCRVRVRQSDIAFQP